MDLQSKYICTSCGTLGDGKSHTPGSFLIEVLLWLFFIVPGIIYSVWRLSGRKKVCGQCLQPTLIPTTSPAGERMLQKFSDETQVDALEKLNQLASLKDKRIVTEEEFQAQKKKILEG